MDSKLIQLMNGMYTLTTVFLSAIKTHNLELS